MAARTWVRAWWLPLAAALMVILVVAYCATAASGQIVDSAGMIIVPDTTDDNLSPDEFRKVDSVPQVTNEVQPVYPESEKEAGVSGEVWVKMLVNKQGLVRKVRVLKREKASIALEESAVKACREWRFTPAKVDGKPVAVWVSTKIVFTLAEKPKK